MTTLFITHDLSTVYYLGGEVMVITKGEIVERGPVSTVMHEPSHPYTKLLLDSIPQPDPDQPLDQPDHRRRTRRRRARHSVRPRPRSPDHLNGYPSVLPLLTSYTGRRRGNTRGYPFLCAGVRPCGWLGR